MENEPILYKRDGNLNSVYPPTTYLTFGYWIYLVPQYKPENILILGYENGTVAGLIRLLYGDVPITAIDIEPCKDRYGVNFIQIDAREYIKNCSHFDAVIVDLFDKEGMCDFIKNKEFVDNLSRIANYVIVNTSEEMVYSADMYAYKCMELVGMNKPSGLSNCIYYYQTKKIPNLHPFS